MSIVGTRPPLISETNLYEPHHKAKEALEAVAAELNLSKASVTSYLPYKKGVYFRENCEREQISVVAEGLRRMRQRQKAVEELKRSHDEQHLWKCIVAFQGYR